MQRFRSMASLQKFRHGQGQDSQGQACNNFDLEWHLVRRQT